MPTSPNDPAFPFQSGQYGLTKREYFAAMVMQGLCSQAIFVGSHAARAVEFADALIAELNK